MQVMSRVRMGSVNFMFGWWWAVRVLRVWVYSDELSPQSNCCSSGKKRLMMKLLFEIEDAAAVMEYLCKSLLIRI